MNMMSQRLMKQAMVCAVVVTALAAGLNAAPARASYAHQAQDGFNHAVAASKRFFNAQVRSGNQLFQAHAMPRLRSADALAQQYPERLMGAGLVALFMTWRSSAYVAKLTQDIKDKYQYAIQDAATKKKIDAEIRARVGWRSFFNWVGLIGGTAATGYGLYIRSQQPGGLLGMLPQAVVPAGAGLRVVGVAAAVHGGAAQ